MASVRPPHVLPSLGYQAPGYFGPSYQQPQAPPLPCRQPRQNGAPRWARKPRQATTGNPNLAQLKKRNGRKTRQALGAATGPSVNRLPRTGPPRPAANNSRRMPGLGLQQQKQLKHTSNNRKGFSQAPRRPGAANHYRPGPPARKRRAVDAPAQTPSTIMRTPATIQRSPSAAQRTPAFVVPDPVQSSPQPAGKLVLFA